jgi:hypothetical protein
MSTSLEEVLGRLGVEKPPDEATTTKRSSSPRGWNEKQLGVARKLYEVGRQRGESDDAIRAALAAGIVESEFNPDAVGDKDQPDGAAYGVLQQRRAGGYDTAKASDPVAGVEYAAGAFYDNARKVRGYRTPGHLAAEVQRPRRDLRGRYDQELPRADELFKQFAGQSSSQDGRTPATPPPAVQGRARRPRAPLHPAPAATPQSAQPGAAPAPSSGSPGTPKPASYASPAPAAPPQAAAGGTPAEPPSGRTRARVPLPKSRSSSLPRTRPPSRRNARRSPRPAAGPPQPACNSGRRRPR